MPFHCHACVDMSAGQQATCFSEGSLFASIGHLHRAKRLHKTYKQLCMHTRYITIHARTDLEEHAVKFAAAFIVVHFVCMHSCLYAFRGPKKLQSTTRSHVFRVIIASTLNQP